MCQALSCLLDIHLGANLDMVPDCRELTLLARKIIIPSGSHKGMQNGNSDEDPLRRAHATTETHHSGHYKSVVWQERDSQTDETQ